MNNHTDKKSSSLESIGISFEQIGTHPLAEQRGKFTEFNQKVSGYTVLKKLISNAVGEISRVILSKVNVKISEDKKELLATLESHKYYILGVAATEKRLLICMLSNMFGPKMVYDAITCKEFFTGMDIPYKSTYRKNYVASGGLSTINLFLLGDLTEETRNKGLEHFDGKDYVIIMGMVCMRLIIHICYALVMGHFLHNYLINGVPILEKAKQIALMDRAKNTHSGAGQDQLPPLHDKEE